MRRTTGVLPSQDIRVLAQSGVFGIEYNETVEEKIQPASYEPQLEETCYRVPAGWRVTRGKTILESLGDLPSTQRQQVDIRDGHILEPETNKSWIVFLEGTYTQQPGMWASASPKSTEGRLGNEVKLLADSQSQSDLIKGAYHGKLAVRVTPRTFFNEIHPGLTMTQLMFFNGDYETVSDSELNNLAHSGTVINLEEHAPSPFIHNGLDLTVDLHGTGSESIVGYKARWTPDPIIRDRRDHPWENFFSPIHAPGERGIRLNTNDTLFILATREYLRIPPHLAGEMVAIVQQHGGISFHDAGYFDPGFGYGKNGEVNGCKGVIEAHAIGKKNEFLRNGDGCGRMIYFHMLENPDKTYGFSGNNYHRQTRALLAKYFTMPDA